MISNNSMMLLAVAGICLFLVISNSKKLGDNNVKLLCGAIVVGAAGGVYMLEKDNDDDDFTNQREKFYNSENDVNGFEDEDLDGFEDDDHDGFDGEDDGFDGEDDGFEGADPEHFGDQIELTGTEPSHTTPYGTGQGGPTLSVTNNVMDQTGQAGPRDMYGLSEVNPASLVSGEDKPGGSRHNSKDLYFSKTAEAKGKGREGQGKHGGEPFTNYQENFTGGGGVTDGIVAGSGGSTFTGNNQIETYGNEDFTGIPGQHILNSAKKSPFKNFSSNVKETFNNTDLMPQNEGFWGSVENFADQGNAKGAAQEGVKGVLSSSDPFENFLQATCKQINTPQGSAALQEQLAITYKGAPTSWGSQLIEALKSGDGIGCDMKFGKK